MAVCGGLSGSGVPAVRAAGGGLVAAHVAGTDRGRQVGPGDGGGCRDAVDGGAEGAGDVDPGSFGVGAGPARAPGQPGGPAQLADQRLALSVSLPGGGAVCGPVGGGEFIIELPDPVAVGVEGGGVQQWPAV